MARDADALDADREGKRTTRGRIRRGGDGMGEGERGRGSSLGEDRSTPHVAGYKSTVLNKL